MHAVVVGIRHATQHSGDDLRCLLSFAGRVGREFGSKASLKKAKTGGMSNREKERRKRLPIAARGSQVRKRMDRTKQKSRPKNFKGHVRR